jgi:hypothetical protein
VPLRLEPRGRDGFQKSVRERQKVKTYFLPGISAKNHWQSQRFFEVKATKTRLEGFIFGRTLIRRQESGGRNQESVKSTAPPV